MCIMMCTIFLVLFGLEEFLNQPRVLGEPTECAEEVAVPQLTLLDIVGFDLTLEDLNFSLKELLGVLPHRFIG
jgi:hypothetical protein